MVEINNKTRSKINLRLVKKISDKFLEDYGIANKTVSIAFVGDGKIRKLNKIYRDKDKVTDVLSFADDDEGALGEIIIDYAQIKRQSRKFSKNTEQELVFILVHGLLHLLGYEDKTDKGAREMEEEGKKFISNNL